MSAVDQKRAFNRLKRDLEPFRNIIIKVDSVLIWEKNYYPALIAGIVTAIYLLIWQLDLSFITMMALTGLFVTLFDYLHPSLARFTNNPDNWNGKMEERFEHVCMQCCNLQNSIAGCYDYLFSLKERKSTVFVLVVSAQFLLLAWLGAVFNNFLFMWMLTLIVALLPGLYEKQILKQLCSLCESKIKQVREKVIKSE